MKNIHLQKTDKPSRLYLNGFQVLSLDDKIEIVTDDYSENQHIFITSNEEIKKGNWYLEEKSKFNPRKLISEEWGDGQHFKTFNQKGFRKIILTTDQDLIKDGIQAIPDEFLQWFINNPSCEYAEVELIDIYFLFNKELTKAEEIIKTYKIIIPKEKQCTCKIGQPYNNACCKVHGSIPKEEPKETLEEAAECKSHHSEEDFIRGAKWQAERSYSEEDMKQAFKNGSWVASWSDMGIEMKYDNFETWFEQFKK